jgi:LPS-assembly protein
MGRADWFAAWSVSLALAAVLTILPTPSWAASKESPLTTMSATPASASPIEIAAQRIDYLKDEEIFEADGEVVIRQGAMRLTSDHATVRMLPGILIATGHVTLSDPRSDIRAEHLELNVNTEAGVLTNGELYIKPSNTFVKGRLLQRFSEDHYRVKEGSFTNCDAQEGEVPAWRFKFKDLDLNAGDSVGMKNVWLCVNDTPLIPFPTLTYPLTTRQSGLLIPNAGWDNRFGIHYQQSYYWAINPSQDLLVSPFYYSELGYGSDFEYRYKLDRKSSGQWYLSALQQTQVPKNNAGDASDTKARELRGLLSGSHTQQVTPDLLVRAQIALVSDAQYYQQLSNSGALRASPSGESNLLVAQRFTYGNAYLLGQYLQPLESGGKDTFQRLPEIGYALANTAPFGGPLLFGLDTNFVNFTREEGFKENRVDLVPGLSTDVLEVGHVVGFTPQVKFREVYYSRGIETTQSITRETFWASLDATSKLSRRFNLPDGGGMLHTIEPGVIYEFVPATNQSNINQIDQVDDLPMKNLLTYSLHSRLLEREINGRTFNWLDLILAQSYHVGAVQTSATNFDPNVPPAAGTATQPLKPATVPVDGRKFSDIWMRAVIGDTVPPMILVPGQAPAFGRGAGAGTGLPPPIYQYLTIDAFFDPYKGGLSQWNTDFRVQQSNYWYAEVGQRYTRDGNRVRRGDLWNAISFNEVYAPTPEVQFVTAGGGFRTPWGWTIGAKAYYDIKTKQSSEYDIVALYQNPCKCWSLGLYYLQFPDRAQYNFMLSLTGIGWTEGFGTAVMKSILSPLLAGERGLPWAAYGGHYGRSQPAMGTSVPPLPAGR